MHEHTTTCCRVHSSSCSAAACRFALPAMLPLISPDLKLTDSQGALLTVGYTVRSTCWCLRLLSPTLTGQS